MPIIVRPQLTDPLSQGDVLQGVSFAVAQEDGKVTADNQAAFCLVISRPCKALRDTTVVVAPITSYQVQLAEAAKLAKDGERLEKTRRFMAGLRDGVKGGDYSDALYLGPLEPGSSKRFAAQMTSLSTIRVPPPAEKSDPEKPDERTRWIQKHRVWRLDGEFLRDLHVRLVLTYSRLGFDDFSWFSDADLEVTISAGEQDVVHCQRALLEARQAIHQKEAESQSVPAAMREEIKKQEKALEQAKTQLAPYQAEQTRRRPSS